MIYPIIYDILKDSELTDFTKLYLIADFDKVLSLGLIEEDKTVDEEIELMIMNKIKERDLAKKEKNYEKADQIRNELFARGIKIIDGKEKTTYEII